jgi:hypothetical protein
MSSLPIVTIANDLLPEPEDDQPEPEPPEGWSATLQQVVIILAQQCPWILTAIAMLLHR